MKPESLASLPWQPRDTDGPTFREAWEAQAFAMTVMLHQRGVFTWSEWAETLADEIKRAQAHGDPDIGNTYYHHWLKALERIVIAKGATTAASLHEMAHAWEEAARNTPHGKPIVLGAVTGD